MRGKKYKFTEEQIEYILTNLGKESPYSMKKKFGCSWEAVANVARNHGLDVQTSNDWTEEEIETLKSLAPKYHYTKIAKIMGKTKNAIYIKSRRLGITLIQNRRKWTKEEEKYLTKVWGKMSIEYIAQKMQRTIFSLKVKAVRMGLGPMIKNNYELLTISDIVDLLNVSRDRITNTWVGLGLKLKAKKLTKKWDIYTVTWEDLWTFLENNQNEWDSRNLEKNIFGEEPEWLKEKRQKDKIENPLWYRRWEDWEIELVESLFNKGKTYQEIGDLMDRSEYAVATVLRNLGYSYRLPQFWRGYELKYLKDNYENMTHSEIAEVLGRTSRAVEAKAEELGYQKLSRAKK